MTVTGRLNVVLVALFVGVLGFWWWGLNDYRDTTRDIASLRVELEKMKAHVVETERVLAAIELLKTSIQDVRDEADAALEDSKLYIGVERIDRLERLLQDDLARRGGGDASDGVAGGLSGAGGGGTGFESP